MRPRRLHAVLIASAVTLAWPAGSTAQIVKRTNVRTPTVWASAGIGLLDLQTVTDGTSNSVWVFSRGTPQLRGGLEYGLRNASSAGIIATFARPALRYFVRDALVPQTADQCNNCDARAEVITVQGVFRAGGGGRSGFHQVLEIAAGVTHYRNFEARSTGRALVPAGETDLSGAVGIGGGYSLSPRLQINLVQDFGLTLHQGENLRGDESRTAQSRTLRVSVRYGAGSRSNAF